MHQSGVSLVAQSVKNLPAMQETGVLSLGQKDPLEKEVATSVFLPRESHGQRNLVIYSPWGCNSWNHHHHVPKEFIKEAVTYHKSQKLSKAKLSERLTLMMICLYMYTDI